LSNLPVRLDLADAQKTFDAAPCTIKTYLMKMLIFAVWTLVVFACGYAAANHRTAAIHGVGSAAGWVKQRVFGSLKQARAAVTDNDKSDDNVKARQNRGAHPTEQHLANERAAIEQLIANRQEKEKK
jgi:hypothetical protein